MNRGFSLLEASIYLVLVIIIMPLIAMLLFFTVDNRARSNNSSLLLLEGERVVDLITQTIKQAQEINQPAIGVSGDSLSLMMLNENQNPTIFNLVNGSINIKEGVGDALPLTSNKIVVTNLIFTNASKGATPGLISIEFSLSAQNFSKKFYVSASLSH